jgi:hypothetical protein
MKKKRLFIFPGLGISGVRLTKNNRMGGRGQASLGKARQAFLATPPLKQAYHPRNPSSSKPINHCPNAICSNSKLKIQPSKLHKKTYDFLYRKIRHTTFLS